MEAKLCFIGHGLMENRCGLIVDARLTRVSGHAERLAALDMIEPRADRPRAVTLALRSAGRSVGDAKLSQQPALPRLWTFSFG